MLYLVPTHAATLDGMLRSLVIGQFAHYGDVDTIKEAQKRCADYCSGGYSLPVDLKAAVFSISLANGDTSTFDQLVKVPTFLHHVTSLSLVLFFLPQLHDATDSNEEKVRIYRCLGRGKTEELTSRCLEFSLSVSCI